MAFVKNRRSRIYRIKYMSRYQFLEVLHQSRYEKIRIDNMGRDHIAFVSGLMYQYHSSRDTTQKLDIMCLLWIYVARIHDTPFCKDKWDEEDIEDYTRSYQILESFGHALRCCGVIRDRRFMDVFRNIETQISELGYYPYYAVKEKIKELNGEYSDYTPRYEITRLVSFKKFDYVNVERFDKIKHHNLKCPITYRAQIMLMQDSKYEYWADKEGGEGGVFAYASITREPKREQSTELIDTSDGGVSKDEEE